MNKAEGTARRHARPPRAWTRRLLRFAVGLGLVALVGFWAVSAAAHAVSAGVDLRHGKSAAEAAKRETSPDEIESGPLLQHLSVAATDFRKAHAHLSAVSVRALDWLPVLGRQIRSARALAGAGATVADAATRAVTQLRGNLTTVPAAGSTRLDRLRGFLAIGSDARARVDHVSLGPTKGLIGPLATAHNQLLDELVKVRTGLDRGVSATRALVDLLSGQHRVLVLIASNAEMRAESGMPEDIATLSIDNGSVRFTDRGSSSPYVAARGAVPAPADFTALWGWMGATQGFEEMLASPRFDVTGPLAAKLWAASGQGAVDAVIVVDPVFLRAILAVTGPIPGPGAQVNATNVVAQLLHGQYLAFPAQGSQTAQRKDELGVLAGSVFDRLNGGGYSFVRMGVEIAAAARGRHVLMWSAAPADEAEWATAGAGGQLNSQSLGLSILNRGQNKLDYLLSSDATLAIQPSSGDTACTLVVHLHNGAVPGEPAEVNGPSARAQHNLLPGQPRLGAGDYLGIVAVSLPGDATDVRLLGDARPNIFGPDGPSLVIGMQDLVPRGRDFTLTLTFRLPGAHGVVRLEPSARVPATTWYVGTATYDGSEAHALGW